MGDTNVATTIEAAAEQAITPDHIMQIGCGFWASKTLLSAVEIGVFTELARQSGIRRGVTRAIAAQQTKPRSISSMRWLRLDCWSGLTVGTPTHPRRTSSWIVPTVVHRRHSRMFNSRLYGFWGSLTEALRTGMPQNETKTGGDFFAVLYADQDRLRQFLHAMTGHAMGAAQAIARQFHRYQTFVDIGAAEGGLPVQVALAHPHLTGIGFDLPAVRAIFDDHVGSFGLSDQLDSGRRFLCRSTATG